MSREKVDLIIDRGVVICVDKNMRILSPGSIAVARGRIVSVGRPDAVRGRFHSEEVIDAKGKIVAPGLIDCHAHLAQALLRNSAENVDALTWLKEYIWPLQGNYTKREGRLSAELCLLEMIRSGTTSFLEVLLHTRYGLDGIAEAVQQSGLRGFLAKSVMDSPQFSGESILHKGMQEDRDESIGEAVDAIKKWNRKRGSRVKVWFGPRPVGNCSPKTYREISRLARKYNVGVTIHHSEVWDQVDFTLREYGMKPTYFMKDVGLLGANIVLAHCIFVDEMEVKLLAKTGTHVCHVPSSDMKLAMGVSPVSSMLRNKVNICLGCNGGPNNNSYDMIREAGRAILLQRAVTRDPLSIRNEDAFEMMTIRGAKALGIDRDVGSIEVGKKADLLIIDRDDPSMHPTLNPVASVLHAASSRDVETVIIDGKMVMKNREIQTMDQPRILREVDKTVDRLVSRSGVKIRSTWRAKT